MAKDDRVLKKLEAALAAKNPKTYVNAYFAKHHEAFEIHYDGWTGSVKEFWEIAAVTFAEEQVVGKSGKALSAASLRKSWERFQAKRNKRIDRKQPTTQTVAAALAQQLTYAPIEAPSESRVRKPLMMTPAKPLQHGEVPQDDGSALPKPLGPVRK